jgi:Protein of unknown function (DUF3800)
MDDKPIQLGLFCDEAGKETDRFLAVGGLVVSSTEAVIIRKHFARICADLNIQSEVKWNKIKQGNKEKYQSIIHSFFGLMKYQRLAFHCLLIDFDRFDHALRDDGGKNESLKRMYYQLILHRLGKKHGQRAKLYVFPDKAKELAGLDAMKTGLNSVLMAKHESPTAPIKAIELRDSESEPLLQLNDLILGAVCYQKNRRFEALAAGHPKANLAGFVLGKSGLENYDKDTAKSRDDFTIWNLKSQYLKGS